jgi:hypothetical protein
VPKDASREAGEEGELMSKGKFFERKENSMGNANEPPVLGMLYVVDVRMMSKQTGEKLEGRDAAVMER